MNPQLQEAFETFAEHRTIITTIAINVLSSVLSSELGDRDIFFQKVCSLTGSPYIVSIVLAKKKGLHRVDAIPLGTPIPDAELAAAIAGATCLVLFKAGLHDVAVTVHNNYWDGFVFRNTSDEDVNWGDCSGFPCSGEVSRDANA